MTTNNDPRELLRTAITEAAQSCSVDPEAVATLIESAGTVTVADDGTVTGADAAVAALLQSKPYLAKPLPPIGQGRDRHTTPKVSGLERGRQLHAERNGKESPFRSGHHDYL